MNQYQCPPPTLKVSSLATQASLGLDDMALADDDAVLALHIAAEENAAAARDEAEWFGLVPPEQTVMIRVYSDDADDMLLADIKPRFIVAFEPSQEFIRRIEVSAVDLSMVHVVTSLNRCIGD